MEDQLIIEKSKKWIAAFVIGLQLCPFAKMPFEQNKIRYVVMTEKDPEQQLGAFWKEVELLSVTPKSTLSTTILIFPGSLSGFDEYLDLYHLATDLLAVENKSDEFQLASFHPQYIFEGTAAEDVTNYTNRSPYPFIHILRVEEVKEAIDHFPDIDAVPVRNMQKMKDLGKEGIQALWEKI